VFSLNSLIGVFELSVGKISFNASPKLDIPTGFPFCKWNTLVKVKVKFICIAHFMYKTIQSALHKIKALQQGTEKALKIFKRI